MKKIKMITGKLLFPICIACIFSGCSLFGLDLQEDYDRTPHTIDPALGVTTWQYMKNRSTVADPSFTKMMAGITYAGIDSNEYKAAGRTFVLLNDAAVKDVWKLVLTSAKKSGTKWEDYPKADVKNYLLYLILDGVYDHYTLPAIGGKEVKTFAPTGAYATQSATAPFFIPTFTENPNSLMKIEVYNGSPGNTSDYPIRINDVVYVRTSSLLATNGSIHVMNSFVTTNLPQ